MIDHEPIRELLSTGDKLTRIGLTESEVAKPGVRVLDVHAGFPTLPESEESDGTKKVIGFNPFDPESEIDTLPFAPTDTELFSYITVTDGILREAPDTDAIALYLDALRLLKEHGQIRVYDPFKGDEDDPMTLQETLSQLIYDKELENSFTVRTVTPDTDPTIKKPYMIVEKHTYDK